MDRPYAQCLFLYLFWLLTEVEAKAAVQCCSLAVWCQQIPQLFAACIAAVFMLLQSTSTQSTTTKVGNVALKTVEQAALPFMHAMDACCYLPCFLDVCMLPLFFGRMHAPVSK
jgi:hypothetical protein